MRLAISFGLLFMNVSPAQTIHKEPKSLTIPLISQYMYCRQIDFKTNLLFYIWFLNRIKYTACNNFIIPISEMLYIIPTPVWNRDDITVRWLDLLKSLEYLICEDTRTTMKLLSMYDINFSEKKLWALTSFTDQGKMNHYLNVLKEHDVWLVSEAGTPGLSDPGKSMVQLCNDNNLAYTILPGANALVPAVVWAGFPTTHFEFLWFFPAKKWRKTLINYCMQQDHALFFYESVHRLEKLIAELASAWFIWQISITKELSKRFEQQVTGTLEEIQDMIKTKKLPIKGEFVVWIFPIK